MRVLGLIGALPVFDAEHEVPRSVALLRALADRGDTVTLLVATALDTPTRRAVASAIGGTVATPTASAHRVRPRLWHHWAFGLRIAADARSPLAVAARSRLADFDIAIGFDAPAHGVASTLADVIPTVMDVVDLEGLAADGDWARSSADRWRVQPHRSWERRVLARAMALTTDNETVVDRTFRLYYRRPTVIATPSSPSAGARAGDTLAQIAADATVRLADINAGRTPTPPADPAALKAEVLDVLNSARDPLI